MKTVGGTYLSGDGSWGDQVRWHTAEGALTSPSVNGVSRRRLITLAMAAGMRECVGARLLEY